MSTTYYLYLKTHRVTGLKYLGKTVRNPYQYKGSGSYWINHINKHGYDVETTILLETQSEDKLKDAARKYSEEWNIVESPSFANLVPEDCTGGDTSKTPGYIEGMKNRNQVPWNKGKKGAQVAWNKGLSKDDPRVRANVEKAHAVRKKKGYVPWNKGKQGVQEAWNKGISPESWTCEVCGKQGKGPSNYKRWHGPQCRSR
jgi:rubrerythrin